MKQNNEQSNTNLRKIMNQGFLTGLDNGGRQEMIRRGSEEEQTVDSSKEAESERGRERKRERIREHEVVSICLFKGYIIPACILSSHDTLQ